MLVLEAGAFGCAGFANLGAELADLPSVGASPGHERDGLTADIGAIPEQLNAVRTGLDICLLQTRRGTMFAFSFTTLAG